MDDPAASSPDHDPTPEANPPPASKVFLGGPTRSAAPATSHVHGLYQRTPEPDPPFWTSDGFKLILLILVAGAVGGWGYYQFVWLYRLPQERNLTDLQGKSMQVSIVGRDEALLQYTLPDSDTMRYLSIATLSPTDQAFIAKLGFTPLAKLPLNCTLTDLAGKETAVRVTAHNSDWAQCALISDGSTSYIPLAGLAPSDQAVIRLLPVGMRLDYPLDYTLTGAPEPGAKVRFLGRNDDTVEYLELADGKKYFTAITELSKTDQSLVRELPSYMKDPLPGSENNAANETAAKLAKEAENPNLPIMGSKLKALVVIHGDYGSGTGFVSKMHDNYFVVTNQHVLSGNKKFTITGMDGTKFPTDGALYAAVDYDVAIIKIPDSLAKNSLEIMDDPQTNAKPGDQITIPGNSQGAGVPMQINGQLLAIGPQLVEVNAQLIHGISGSPIIDRQAGKVVGIATMSMTYKIDNDRIGLTTETRWFGYRVDNIDPNKGWIKIDKERFIDEGTKVNDAWDLYESLAAVLSNKPPSSITSETVRTTVMEFRAQVNSAVARNNRQDVQTTVQAFFRKLRSLADNGVADLRRGALYPYHAEQLKELDTVRGYLDEAFEDNSKEYNNLINLNR